MGNDERQQVLSRNQATDKPTHATRTGNLHGLCVCCPPTWAQRPLLLVAGRLEQLLQCTPARAVWFRAEERSKMDSFAFFKEEEEEEGGGRGGGGGGRGEGGVTLTIPFYLEKHSIHTHIQEIRLNTTSGDY